MLLTKVFLCVNFTFSRRQKRKTNAHFGERNKGDSDASKIYSFRGSHERTFSDTLNEGTLRSSRNPVLFLTQYSRDETGVPFRGGGDDENVYVFSFAKERTERSLEAVDEEDLWGIPT